MIKILRYHTASVLLHWALRLMPNSKSSGLHHVVDSLMEELPREMKDREGGVIIIPWSTTVEGRALSLEQQVASYKAATKVRRRFEKIQSASNDSGVAQVMKRVKMTKSSPTLLTEDK